MSVDQLHGAVVGVSGNGRCSGVVVAPNFILTSDHCVNAVGTPVAIVDATGTQVVGRVCAKDAQTGLAVLCSMPIQSSIVALGAELPAAGSVVTIESRPPRQQAWSASTLVTDAAAGDFSVRSIADRRLPDSGDSGSPAFVNEAVVGILREVRGHDGEVARYAAIPPAAHWIRSAIQQHTSACTEWIRQAGRSPLSR